MVAHGRSPVHYLPLSLLGAPGAAAPGCAVAPGCAGGRRSGAGNRRAAGRGSHGAAATARGRIGLAPLLQGQLDRASDARVVDLVRQVLPQQARQRRRQRPQPDFTRDQPVEVLLDLELGDLLPLRLRNGRVRQLRSLQVHLRLERVQLGHVPPLERTPLVGRDVHPGIVRRLDQQHVLREHLSELRQHRVAGLPELRGILRWQRAHPAQILLDRQLAALVGHQPLLRLAIIVRRLRCGAHRGARSVQDLDLVRQGQAVHEGGIQAGPRPVLQIGRDALANVVEPWTADDVVAEGGLDQAAHLAGIERPGRAVEGGNEPPSGARGQEPAVGLAARILGELAREHVELGPTLHLRQRPFRLAAGGRSSAPRGRSASRRRGCAAGAACPSMW